MLRWLCVACLLLTTGCREQQHAARNATGNAPLACDEAVVRVVEHFGARLKLVSLLGPDAVVGRSIRSAYAPFVTPELLLEWLADPRSAPGREVSNPWPARIAIESIAPEGAGCRVYGDIVFVETADTSTILELRPITMLVREGDGWRISAFESRRQHPVR